MLNVFLSTQNYEGAKMNYLKPNGTTYRANLNLNHRYPGKLFAIVKFVLTCF
jgi:hypothetical protein